MGNQQSTKNTKTVSINRERGFLLPLSVCRQQTAEEPERCISGLLRHHNHWQDSSYSASERPELPILQPLRNSEMLSTSVSQTPTLVTTFLWSYWTINPGQVQAVKPQSWTLEICPEIYKPFFYVYLKTKQPVNLHYIMILKVRVLILGLYL